MSVKRMLAALLPLMIALAAAFALEPSLKIQSAPYRPAPALKNEAVFKSYIGNYIKVGELPPGFYAWREGASSTSEITGNAPVSALNDMDEYYRGFKFTSGEKAWIKMLVKPDRKVVFTSNKILRQSNDIENLELISNKVLTRINESQSLKMFDFPDEFTKNIYSAIYFALILKMSVGEEKVQIAKDDGLPFLKPVRIDDTVCAYYYENWLPGYFNQVKVSIIVKAKGQICDIFLSPLKKTFLKSSELNDRQFLKRFSGLLISDIAAENKLLLPDDERKNNMYHDRLAFIKTLGAMLAVIKDEINRTPSFSNESDKQ